MIIAGPSSILDKNFLIVGKAKKYYLLINPILLHCD